MSTLRTTGRTDIGTSENNEDVVVATDRLALVADGMGGHPGGEIAAEVVAGVVPAVFTGQSVDELQAAVRATNWAIRERAAAQPGLEGMGTTVCAAGLLSTGHVPLVNVGDSRGYLFHEGSLTRLTQDHSLTAELIERGELREEEATQHPYHGILTRALGVGPLSRSTGQCSPSKWGIGLHFAVTDCLPSSDEEIGSALAGEEDVAAIVDKLINSAIASGGRDNVSLVIAEVLA